MSRFGPDPQAFFDNVYQGPAPWDVGAPQPALIELIREFQPEGRVLDLGCGTGDLAIALAELGCDVLGIDFVVAAVAEARRRAEQLPNEVRSRVEFQVADALHPSRLPQRFGAIADSGFFHLFDPEQCDRLVAEMAATLAPGGRCYMLEFAVEFPVPNVPRAVSEDEIRQRFRPDAGWRILACRPAEFLSRVAPVPAVAVAAARL